MKQIKILIVDDHPMMREALRTALMEEPGLDVIGEASNGMEAITMASETHPDVILMDLLMSGMDGLEATTRIMEADANARVLVVTSLEDEEKILAAIQAGALGYFPKTAPRTFLLEAIHKVADGIPYLPSGIALKLFQGIRSLKIPSLEDTADGGPLTARQEEILRLIGEGHSDQEIGQTLHLEVGTVRSHIHHILQRLGMENRSQVVAYASRKLNNQI